MYSDTVDDFRILRAVAVWCSGQDTLNQTSKASYLFLHCLHTLQAVIPAEENTSDNMEI